MAYFRNNENNAYLGMLWALCSIRQEGLRRTRGSSIIKSDLSIHTQQDSNVRIKVTLDARSINQRWRGKAKPISVYWVRVCSLSYPACKAQASYYIHICAPSGTTLFLQITSTKVRLLQIANLTQVLICISTQSNVVVSAIHTEF